MNVSVHTTEWLQHLYLDLHRHGTGDIRLGTRQVAAARGEAAEHLRLLPEGEG